MDGNKCFAAANAVLDAHHVADDLLHLALQSQDFQLQMVWTAHCAMCGTRLQLSHCVCVPAVASAQECLQCM